MTVADLKVKWRELYGEDTRSCNRVFLWRRLAWRVQELAYGGLSERAKTRIAEINRDDHLRFLPPRGWNPFDSAAQAPTSRLPAGIVRDSPLPSPGAVRTRHYPG